MPAQQKTDILAELLEDAARQRALEALIERPYKQARKHDAIILRLLRAKRRLMGKGSAAI